MYFAQQQYMYGDTDSSAFGYRQRIWGVLVHRHKVAAVTAEQWLLSSYHQARKQTSSSRLPSRMLCTLMMMVG
jgi:hypothetical protein